MIDMHGQKILVIDDDVDLLQIVACAFTRAGGQVYVAASGREGLRQFYAERPNLVILDLMMPGMDGWEVCRQIRQVSDVPLIMLTAMVRNEPVIRGLAVGADDYLIKPFSPEVLLARAQAVLRRVVLSSPSKKPVSFGDDYLMIDLDRGRVFVQGEPVKLSATEHRLLAYLLRNAGRVLTFQQILQHVWGEAGEDNVDYVHVYISRLRRKLEKDAKKPEYLLTEYGLGYRFEKYPPELGQRNGAGTPVTVGSSK